MFLLLMWFFLSTLLWDKKFLLPNFIYACVRGIPNPKEEDVTNNNNDNSNYEQASP